MIKFIEAWAESLKERLEEINGFIEYNKSNSTDIESIAVSIEFPLHFSEVYAWSDGRMNVMVMSNLGEEIASAHFAFRDHYQSYAEHVTSIVTDLIFSPNNLST